MVGHNVNNLDAIMESLVGYGSDDESGENYQFNKLQKEDIERGMDRFRQGEQDVNYDNVQMDMSEESNNNHTGSSNEDDKSSTKSSSSHSSRCSDNSVASSRGAERGMRREDAVKDGKPGNGIAPTETCNKWEQGSRHKIEETHRERYSKGKSDREKKDQNVRHTSREQGHREYRESEHSGHVKGREQDRMKRDVRRSRSRSRERDRERQRSRSRDQSSRKHSRSPVNRQGSSRHRDEASSHYKRSRSRDRNRRSSPGSKRHRSHSRDRGKSSSSSSGSSRRGSYEKKPSKLTILERLGIELRPPEAVPAVTPQQLLQKSIEQQVQQVKTSTGIELPKYYNPAAMNPARYAEQMQKRKLLWGNKAQDGKTEEVKPASVSNNKWEGTTFAQDQDGRMTAKFKRLMGMKDAGGSGVGCASSGPSSNPEGSEILKKQEELFNSMEMQYEVARVATHTHRGVGLGFGTFQYPR
ncbi:arginine/serine-rich coiled-coil protein 2-like isoform X2 [Zootermopsis nevadensis]|uniref:arginine/serine-rich coiled-coil protein 2-like isoform X2 n=1 Tax=Zootermopsis nevadensis TaxID=136037 RepID=UPI000B8E4292|nr:arginine/serine-rich coiled-coil protein 2-like isoform X2 [Zootermopsis nevadensis]